MEEIHKRKAEVKRSKMLTDQAEARRDEEASGRNHEAKDAPERFFAIVTAHICTA